MTTFTVQDQVLELVVHKGMTEADAIAEIETKLRATLPDEIRVLSKRR